MSTLKEQILSLNQQGKTRPEIQQILGCAKSTICYYLSDNQKEKTNLRTIKRRAKHPYIKKLENFKSPYKQPKINVTLHKWKQLIKLKIDKFHEDRKMKKYQKTTFKVQDVLNKFGDNPKCYLTGEPINIYSPREYVFDHVIPVSKGGENTLENLEICTKQANTAKQDLSLDEFYELCKKVIEHKQLKPLD